MAEEIAATATNDLVCDEPSLSDAIHTLSIARERLRVAHERIDEAKANVSRAAIAYVNASSSEQELIERITYVYWNIREVKVVDLAAILFGEGGKAKNLSSRLLPGGARVECQSCRSLMPVRSRSQLDTIGVRGQGETCQPCREKERRESSVRWEASQRAVEARTQALRSMPYGDYLRTPEWLEMRMRKLREASFRCQLCNVGGLLDVHHRTYERRGSEYLKDLIVLCRQCHGKFHDKL